MGWSVSASPAHRASDHQWKRNVCAIHRGKFISVLQQLVDDQRAEIAEHDFDYGLLAGERPTDGETGEAGLTDRRVAHTPGILTRKPARYLESAAIRTWRKFVAVFDVFTEKEQIRVLSEQTA